MSSWLAVLAGRFCRPLCLCRVPCPRWPANYYPADWQADGAKAGPDKADINTAQFDAICIKVVPIQLTVPIWRNWQNILCRCAGLSIDTCEAVRRTRSNSSKTSAPSHYHILSVCREKQVCFRYLLFHILKSSFLSSTPPGCCLILFFPESCNDMFPQGRTASRGCWGGVETIAYRELCIYI